MCGYGPNTGKNMARDKIKILFRHRSMEMGGVEKVLLSILNNLDREKFDCTVLLNLNQGELRDQIPPHVKKISIAKGKEDMPQNLWLQKLALLQRRAVLKRYANNRPKEDAQLLNGEKYDVEIAMDWRDFEAVLQSPNRDSKKIGWFHSEVHIKGFEPILPLVLDSFPKFDHIVYCSARIQSIMHGCYPDLKYPPEKVIINAIPFEEIHMRSEEPATDFPVTDLPVFISLGRLHSRKGFHVLAEAHARLIQKGLLHKVIILGEGEERENLTKQIAQLEIADSFLLLGNKMNPYAYLRRADYFIMPSRSEAWPLVLAEALLLRKPVIATDVGDVAEIMRPDENGLLVKYDIEEIEKAMEIFLTQPETIATFQHNLQRIEEDFDNDKIFRSIENMLLTLTDHP